MSAINRDSLELRRIVMAALRKAREINWDMVETEDGTEGVMDLMEDIAEEAIKKQP